MRLRGALAGGLTTLLLHGCDMGCDRLDKDKRPYTPFGMTTADSPGPSISADVPAVRAPFEPVTFERAPDRSTHWRLAGRALQAPEGYVIESGLVGSFGSRAGSSEGPADDALLWLLPREPSASRAAGELWLYSSSGQVRRVATIPDYIPTSPDCVLQTQLTHSGPSTLMLDVSATCTAQLMARTAVRGIELLSMQREHYPRLWGARLSSSAPGEVLTLGVRSVDRDQDGRDDVQLDVELYSHAPKHAMVARFEWFDRAAGVARDETTTRDSFSAPAKAALDDSRVANSSAAVLERIDNLRRLYGAVCGEAGSARITDDQGQPLSCGDLKDVFAILTQAEAQAHLGQNNPLAAVGALERAAWFARVAADEQPPQLLEQLLQHSTIRKVREPTAVPVRPRDAGNAPSFSPLAFDAAGHLLIQTTTGIFEVTRQGEGFEVRDASDEVNPWPILVISPRGTRWTGVAYSCDRSEVMLLRARSDGELLPSQATTLLAPRPSACTQLGYEPDLPLTPLGFDEQDRVYGYLGATALYPSTDTEPLAAAPGGPRSPSDGYLVLPTEFGLWIAGKETQEFWLSPDHRGGSLHSCVIADDGQNVACLRGRQAVWLDARPPP